MMTCKEKQLNDQFGYPGVELCGMHIPPQQMHGHVSAFLAASSVKTFLRKVWWGFVLLSLCVLGGGSFVYLFGVLLLLLFLRGLLLVVVLLLLFSSEYHILLLRMKTAPLFLYLFIFYHKQITV